MLVEKINTKQDVKPAGIFKYKNLIATSKSYIFLNMGMSQISFVTTCNDERKYLLRGLIKNLKTHLFRYRLRTGCKLSGRYRRIQTWAINKSRGEKMCGRYHRFDR